MADSLGTFLVEAAVISFSGVLAPGPVTAATLAAGVRKPHAGAWIAIGHGIVEFPLMGLIMAGAGTVLASQGFRSGVGLAGGAALLAMAGLMLYGLRRPASQGAPPRTGRPVLTGIVLTGGNPYFLLWWATVGLALSTRGMSLGVLAFGLFAVMHWLCDLVWLEALSLASNKGVGLLGPKTQRVIAIACSSAMGIFGLLFLRDAIKSL